MPLLQKLKTRLKQEIKSINFNVSFLSLLQGINIDHNYHVSITSGSVVQGVLLLRVFGFFFTCFLCYLRPPINHNHNYKDRTNCSTKIYSKTNPLTTQLINPLNGTDYCMTTNRHEAPLILVRMLCKPYLSSTHKHSASFERPRL